MSDSTAATMRRLFRDLLDLGVWPGLPLAPLGKLATVQVGHELLPRPIDEILDEWVKLDQGIKGREYTDAEMRRAEQLDREVQEAKAAMHDKLRAYNTVVIPAGVPAPRSGGPEDTLGKAFNTYLRTGQPNADISDLKVTNAQGEGTGGAGGYLVPDGFRTQIVERMKSFEGIAAVAEEITTQTGNTLPWPTVDDTANSGEIVAEHGTFAAGADVTFGTKELGAYRYAAGGASNAPVRVSVELLQDAAFNVEALLARLLGNRIGRVQATHFATGDASGKPEGILHGVTGLEIAASTGVTYDDLVGFIHAIDPAYRMNARWVFNDTTLGTIRKIKDSNGDPIWRPVTADMGAAAGGPSLLGYPVTIDQAFPNLAPANNTQLWGVFGDIRAAYVVRRVKDVAIVANPWSRAANGEVEFHAWARADGAIQDPNAYKAMTGQA